MVLTHMNSVCDHSGSRLLPAHACENEERLHRQRLVLVFVARTLGFSAVRVALANVLALIPERPQLLRPLFEPFGQILELRLIRDRETGGLKVSRTTSLQRQPAALQCQRDGVACVSMYNTDHGRNLCVE